MVRFFAVVTDQDHIFIEAHEVFMGSDGTIKLIDELPAGWSVSLYEIK